MIKNIVDYLEITQQRFGDKTAYLDAESSVTFTQLKEDARQIAAGLLKDVPKGAPVLVCMEKCVGSIEAFLGVAYTGAFYVPIDIKMPYERIKLIMDTLSAKVLLTRRNDEIPDEIRQTCKILCIEDLMEASYENRDAEIEKRQRASIDADPAYAIFTSGSTGVPKGVVVSHRSVINFTEWWCETFEFDENEVFANQTPFYFDASVKDIYATLRCGATMHIVPKKLFSLPKQLVHFLNEKEITCIDWVPSALCMIVNFHTLEKETPAHLKKVMFLGEVMPTKQFNMWRRALPDVKYANLYGPTEATGDCTYYKIEREFADDEPIPIGYACNNTEVLLLDGDRLVTEEGETGEICVRGCSLAYGYFRNPEKTQEVFVENPLQKDYHERIYRTGDLAKYNAYGELVFLSRKDSQIKHMGHRIELGEIETALGAVDGIKRACCFYDHKKQKIVSVFEGDTNQEEVIAHLKNRLPVYMIPNQFIKVEEMPVNLNGKIDRVLLKETYLQ
ncbi:MAG: amino acid adenylation domain-containing protein [Lachnospiraceae bacterium]|nr:amino acid adenylation domain-containing protein [Lachnospiraceae bacterium]